MSAKRMRLKHERFPIVRRGINRTGQTIELLTNHFEVTVAPPSDGYFYIYIVTIKDVDGIRVGSEVMRREILDRVGEMYKLELHGKQLAYDGRRSLFSVEPLLQHNLLQLNVIVDHVKESPFTYKVSIVYDKQIPMRVIGNGPDQFRVLDAILRQNAVTKGHIVIRPASFPYEPRNLSCGISGYWGQSWRFRATQGGLTLNIDASTALIISAGSLSQFLLLHQGVINAAEIDWSKAKRTLKNLKIKATHSNIEYKISGLSELRCREQMFLFKQKTGAGETEQVEMTVYDYFVRHRNIQLRESGDFPCIDVGKHDCPIYIPVELCCLVPLQCYTEPLSHHQRSRPLQGPKQRMNDTKQALLNSNYGSNSLLQSCGVEISTEFTRVVGRVLKPPMLMFGGLKPLIPLNAKWDIRRMKMLCARKLENWAAVNFSSSCDMRKFCQGLVRCGEMVGYPIDDPLQMFEEEPENASKTATIRVDEMINKVLSELEELPKLLLCILPEKKNCKLYGPWKRKTLSEIGVTTQCVAAPCASGARIGYMTNVLLKINAKEIIILLVLLLFRLIF